MSQVSKTIDIRSNDTIMIDKNQKSIIKKDIVCCICQHGSSNAVLWSMDFICPTCYDAISFDDD